MSLDPRDSARRGRSKSPGRERERSRSRAAEVIETTTRERSRVRVPSPPKSKYQDSDSEDDDRGYAKPSTRGAYEYEERREKVKVVAAEPRGNYGSVSGGGGYGKDDRGDPRGSYGSLSGRGRDDSPPKRDPRSSYGSLGGRGGREREDSPPRYAVPGSFQEEDTEVRYKSGGGGRGRGEKDYYAEVKKTTSYGGRGDGRESKDEYGRAVSPPRDRYQPEVDKYKYDDPRSRDSRDPRRYEEPREGGRGDGGRERGASFNIGVAGHSMSGGIALGHDERNKRSSYVQPPSPSGYQPPYAAGQTPFPEVPGGRQYAEPPKWEYAQPDDKISYTKRQETTTTYGGRPPSPPGPQYVSSSSGGRGGGHGSTAYVSESKYGSSPRSSNNKIVTVEPGSRRGARDPSPNPGLAPRMHSLSLSTGHHGGAQLSLANAPGSPLLESYHGTYQSISPMPSPLMIANTAHGDVGVVEALSPESSDDDRHGGKKTRRTARFHDPAEEASALARALKDSKRAPDTGPLISILPGLTHSQILELRVEYKRIVKTGSEKKGVNVAKHIKLRLKDEDPMLMKACYAVALGRWESEAYWANFWYQGEKSRRELLIESLMGRTNHEIQLIKDGFSDKKYGDSLTKCMKTELKEDKFKKAVLLVLEERKMEEGRIDRGLVEDDVRDLYKAVRSEKGGESAMIAIIVVRSDGHLREVLRLYERTYQANFAREMLKRSGNLVGELLAHILNGVINAPVRDALLIHHALSLSKSDSLRTELLISRLVRYHWDRPHMEAVKREYRNRYQIDMQKAVKEGTRGEWGLFCEGLCVRRMGDEVREVSRVRERVEVETRRY